MGAKSPVHLREIGLAQIITGDDGPEFSGKVLDD